MSSPKPSPPKPDVQVSLELVDVEEAQTLLEHGVRNRPLSKSYVGVLDTAMTREHFKFTHQALGVNARGELFDGQHRLTAVVRSGCPQWFVVVRGLDDDALLVTDRGKPKSLADVAYLAGIQEDRKAVEVASYLFDREYGYKPDAYDLRAFLAVHGEQVVSAVNMAQRKPWFVTAVVQAAIARALHTMHEPRVKQFIAYLRDAEQPPDTGPDAAAGMLWKFIFKTRKDHRHAERGVLYLKTLYALRAFADEITPRSIVEGSPADFPIPPVPDLAEDDEDDNEESTAA